MYYYRYGVYIFHKLSPLTSVPFYMSSVMVSMTLPDTTVLQVALSCPAFFRFQHRCDHSLNMYAYKSREGKYKQGPLPLNLSFIVTMLLRLLILMFIFKARVICGNPCGQEHVSAAEGGDIILRKHQLGNRVINWVLVPGTFIATIVPGEPINEKTVRNEYKGRVRSEADGSLHISNLSPKDQGIYKAESTDDEICVEFNLTVYEKLSSGDIKINHNLTRNDSCSLALLCAVDRRNVTITWSNAHSGHVNVTQGVLYVPPGDVNFTYICTASNPVSNVSKAVIPGKYCGKGNDNSPTSSGRRVFISIPAAFLLIIILAAAYLLYVRWKNRRRQEDEVTMTTCPQVGDRQRQQGNPSPESQGEKQDSATVYSKVQHVEKLDKKETNVVETLYSEISAPKKTLKLPEKKENGVETVYSTVSMHKASL